MTRKDYKLIANAIRFVANSYSNTETMDFKIGHDSAVMDIVKRLSIYLKQDNSKFKESKFVEACL